ncbi:hypothetical protein JB92DRAFT_2165928 [Gautieria morchelliformis]|nr:hypothetical protein JB92DRAFT_2165928 [Gautieria morchelliformis]
MTIPCDGTLSSTMAYSYYQVQFFYQRWVLFAVYGAVSRFDANQHTLQQGACSLVYIYYIGLQSEIVVGNLIINSSTPRESAGGPLSGILIVCKILWLHCNHERQHAARHSSTAQLHRP